MGSQAIPQRTEDGSVHILVTGFGPFGRHKENPAWQIAHSLPDSIPSLKKGGRPIRIHVRPQPVKVSYRYVREQIPPLLFAKGSSEDEEIPPNFDIVVHIGVSHARGYYEMETRAFRDDYYLHDVDGKTRPEGFPSWKEQGAPEMLKIGFDAAAVHERWKAGIPNTDVRLSIDAGRFLCEFILFTSLLEYHRQQKDTPAPVVFCHVPTENDVKDIEKGKNVVLALVRALVHSWPLT